MAVNFEALRKMGTEQLHELNRGIVAVIRERQTQRQQSEMRRFNVGDTAEFFSKQGRKVTIRIDRFNTKSVGGTELDATGKPTMRTWRVAPTLLKAVAS